MQKPPNRGSVGDKGEAAPAAPTAIVRSDWRRLRAWVRGRRSRYWTRSCLGTGQASAKSSALLRFVRGVTDVSEIPASTDAGRLSVAWQSIHTPSRFKIGWRDATSDWRRCDGGARHPGAVPRGAGRPAGDARDGPGRAHDRGAGARGFERSAPRTSAAGLRTCAAAAFATRRSRLLRLSAARRRLGLPPTTRSA